MPHPAILALADGTVFHGTSFGASGLRAGEVVFNTAMTGYQEILTDPSYARQIVTLTWPHVGNTGCNPQDDEARAMHLGGLVVRERPTPASSWRSTANLEDWLVARDVVAVAGIDTRALTRILRERGAQGGCLMAGPDADADAAVAAARAFPGLDGMDLAKQVTTASRYAWSEGSFDLDANCFSTPATRFHVVAYDFGIKLNILRLLVDAGCRLTVVPAQTPAREALALDPDGIFLSNGPGDPQACGYAIEAIREFIAARIPLFGICLGHQLLALAAGARTIKMPHGHHGANHPVQELASGRVMISSQNHGFAVDESSLPASARATHRSLFDGSNQGIALTDAPAFSFQGHPEASPGPADVGGLFARFAATMQAANAA
ncbi:glutamine-hydrolyzing carbamoyl-phosphate synthase small subunit [Denitratimonas tolerans]|uniref:Carbamoyl phosphate synthase small chain n=1 Tax=Denitratimonas tolerans TaxID=1338420 RepID=A0AAW9QXH3_9GAMM